MDMWPLLSLPKMVDRLAVRHGSRILPVLALTCGVLVGGAIVGVSVLTISSGGVYWNDEVSVPSSANASNPYVVSFHDATFSMWWPEIPPGPYSGLVGVTILITEPSGVSDQTGTGCVACTFNPHSWYSNDGVVGISWYDSSAGDVTLLVRA